VVALAEVLAEFHAERGWELLGYEKGTAGLNTYLAEPDRGMKRRHYFRLIEMHRELREVRGVGADTLEGIEVSKVVEVLPAIRDGKVSVEEGLEDARSMGWRDLRAQYGGNGSEPEPDPEMHECPECGRVHPKAAT
jgi:hypothetical protein